MSETQDNLKAAFAGESQANRRYLAFASKAQADDQAGLAKLFKTAAESETVHALNHLNVMGGVKSAIENLETAINGEIYEVERMYPQFIEDAQTENWPEAVLTFSGARKVEEKHAMLFKQALDDLKNGVEVKELKYFVCQVCGNVEIGEAPDHCQICQSPKEKFKEVVL